MKCPTCPESVDDVCCDCGDMIATTDQELRANPFCSEIHGNEDLHLQCSSCYERDLMDI